MTNPWNERFAHPDFFYGQDANAFLIDFISAQQSTGKILFPGEGEGRNAVFAASKGWHVDAFDNSEMAQKKALAFAKSRKLNIDYQLASYHNFNIKPEYYDVCALIYVHFPIDQRKTFAERIWSCSKPDGHLIIEVFNETMLRRNTFGPKELSLLYTKENILNDFGLFKTELIEEKTVVLHEGAGHDGQADVIRFIGRK